MDELNEELFAYIIWRAQELTVRLPTVEPQWQDGVDVNWAYVDRQARYFESEYKRKSPG